MKNHYTAVRADFSKPHYFFGGDLWSFLFLSGFSDRFRLRIVWIFYSFYDFFDFFMYIAS